MNNTSPQLKAFKRGPSLELSKWYMGMLMTNLAESKDTNGAFFLMEVTAAPGTEPPPHVHTREDELFYALEGEFDVYVGKEAFKVETGESIFCPKLNPHAFAVRSPRGRVLILVTPGGLEEAFRSESSPAQNLDLPTGASTYSTSDLKQAAQRFSEYGVTLPNSARGRGPTALVSQPPSTEPRQVDKKRSQPCLRFAFTMRLAT